MTLETLRKPVLTHEKNETQKTRLELILFRNHWRKLPNDNDIYESLKIPDLEILIGEGFGLQFTHKRNLFYYTYSIDVAEKILKYIEHTWKETGKKGTEISFSTYCKVASGKLEEEVA